MTTRHFYVRRRPGSRPVAGGAAAFADEDDGLIETWMIGVGNETSSARRRPARIPGDRR